VNTDEPVLGLFTAERRVREIQTKLHRWALQTQRDLWRARCPVMWHAGFGGRVRETDRSKYRHRALIRPYLPGSAAHARVCVVRAVGRQ
jgi:hypothetical protein